MAWYADMFRGYWSGLTEKGMKDKFDELDADKSGMLDKEEMLTALANLGKSKVELVELAEKMPNDKQLDFEGFKALASGKEPVWKDRPLTEAALRRLSARSAAMRRGSAASNRSAATSNQDDGGGLTEKQVRAQFSEVDAFLNGCLDKGEVAKVLLHLRRPKDEIEALTETMPDDAKLDYNALKELLHPTPPEAWTPKMPKFAKMVGGYWSGFSEEEMQQKFEELDTDGSGMLDKDELLTAMAGLGKSEKELDSMSQVIPEDKQLDFEGFKALASGEVPVWKDAKITDRASKRLASLSEPDMRKEFVNVDAFLCMRLGKSEISRALRCMGRTALEASVLVQDVPEDTKLGFGEFKELLAPAPSWTTTMPSFVGMIRLMCSGMAEKEKREKFTELDADKSGMLDKEEIFKALSGLGKPNDVLLDFNEKMPASKQLDYLGFKALALGKEPVWKTQQMSEEATKRLNEEVQSIRIFNAWRDGRK